MFNDLFICQRVGEASKNLNRRIYEKKKTLKLVTPQTF